MHIRIIKTLHKLLPVGGIDFHMCVSLYNFMCTPLDLFAKSQCKIHLKCKSCCFLCVVCFTPWPKIKEPNKCEIIQKGN